MNGLQELGAKFSSDKLYWHSYFQDSMYPRLFDGLAVRRVLELGIGFEGLMRPFLPPDVPFVAGSSLKLWQELWPEAVIFACDIREDALINEGRIHSTACDVTKTSDLIKLMYFCGYPQAGKFEIIIDDASHEYEAQRFAANHLIPAASKLYVIEDVFEDQGNALAKEFGGELWKGEKGRDDNLVVIRK